MNPYARKAMTCFSIISLLAIVGVIGYYLYLLYNGEAQKLMNSIRHYGASGAIIGISIQTILNILPLPGELTSILLLEIYGPVWGGLYSWIAGVAGSVGGLYLSKWIAKPFFGKMVEPYMSKVDEWMRKHGGLGLLLIRFVPLVPYHFVNYAAGLLQVKLWGFLWTTGLGILPYTIVMSALYAGIRWGSILWGLIGCGMLLLLSAAGWYVKRRKQKSLVNMS
ncbi:TVP38/TMEM64 family protein [Paenibacillus caui]|uniref:TVP38/TMEM64 family protein n=1 Tax=Paenibacillus caui TaxID=2873927 RepID=UPI001CA98852|nr:TVP38/TMEM64 family protein [Paenibacillus caui]